MKPLGKFIEIKPIKQESKSGFILPNAEETSTGVIVAVGDEVERFTPDLIVGYSQYGEVEIDGQIFIKESDIIAYKEEKKDV